MKRTPSWEVKAFNKRGREISFALRFSEERALETYNHWLTKRNVHAVSIDYIKGDD